jgi:hypothetical protein
MRENRFVRKIVAPLLLLVMWFLGCAGAGHRRQSPLPGSVLFANYNPGDKPSMRWGGWRIGGVIPPKEKDGAEAVGFLFTPAVSGQLERVEMLLHREAGTGNVVGYLMTDSGGPGRVMATFSISVRPSSQAETVSASLNNPVLIESSKHYWFILEAIDPINDSTFWPRIENQPETTIAIRRSKSENWHMNGAYGAMLRIYAK